MSTLPTRQLFKLHRYAGLMTAPLILFFAITGIFQVFRLHEDQKSGYKAPAILKGVATFHKAEGLSGDARSLGFKVAIAVAGRRLIRRHATAQSRPRRIPLITAPAIPPAAVLSPRAGSASPIRCAI